MRPLSLQEGVLVQTSEGTEGRKATRRASSTTRNGQKTWSHGERSRDQGRVANNDVWVLSRIWKIERSQNQSPGVEVVAFAT